MPTICPTVLAEEPHAYREQMERLKPFAKRIQIDLMDGEFAPTKSVPIDEVWLLDNILSDLHLMWQRPEENLDKVIALKPNLVIIHAEADIDARKVTAKLHDHDIKAGLCILKDTSVESVRQLLPDFDHLLIFGGKLGYFGGQADLTCLDKIAQAKAINPNLEIGWDGGANDQNAKALVDGGIDVINVGGFIQKSADPQGAYAKLKDIVSAKS